MTSSKNNPLFLRARIFLALFFFLVLTVSVSSLDLQVGYNEEPITFYAKVPLGTSLQITQTCTNSTSNCNNCTIISIQDPYKQIAVSNILMTVRTDDFYYIFTNTSKLGSYQVNGFCEAPGLRKNWYYTFLVQTTSNGEDNTLTFILLLVFSFAVLILAKIFNNPIFAVLSGFIFLGTGVYGMIYGFGDISSPYTRIVSYVIIGIGAILTIASAYDIVDTNYSSTQTEDDEE